MKNKLSNRKFEFTLLGLVILTLLAMLIPYLVTNTPFEYGGDVKPQHFAFYTEFHSMIMNFIETRQFPFYSWTSFLGTVFWSSKTYYGLGDVYNYLSIFIHTHYYNIYMFQTVLKLLVSSFSFYYLSRVYKYNKQTSIILGLSYAFSSWILFFLGQPMFISFCSFLPLFFIGIEKYLEDRKRVFFIFSVAILLCTNYYLFFILSIVTPAYFIYRYYTLHQEMRGMIKSALELILYYGLGVLVTGILIFPTALYITQNERVGAINFIVLYEDIKIYFHLIQGLFVPSQNLIYYTGNPFETGWHATREICLWAGSLTAILLPQVFTDKDKSFKKATIILYSLFLAILIMPVGSMVVHGMSADASFRFTIIVIVMNLLLAGRYINNLELINKKTLKITFQLICIICLLNIPIYLLVSNQITSSSEYAYAYLLSIFSLIVVGCIFYILMNGIKKTYVFLIGIVAIEMILQSGYLIGCTRRKPLGTWDSIHKVTHVLQDQPGELNAYLNYLDEDNYSEYYRVFVPHETIYWSYSHNSALHYQINGTMSYDSTYEPSITELRDIAPQINEFGSPWIFNILDGDIIDFLNVKYAIVVSESELPHQNFELVTDAYRGSLLVYENLNYRPLGTTYNKVITYDVYNGDLSLLENTIICHNEDYSEILSYIDIYSTESSSLVHITYGNNYLSGEVYSPNNSFMVITLPHNKGWTITVNGNKVQTYKVNGGFIGIPIEKGLSSIEMNFMPDGFKTGAVLSVIGVGGIVFIFLIDLRNYWKTKKEN
jgi:Bacterial membrane protein YfhO.